MRDFDLVLYDLDGTLVETAPEICDAVNDVLRGLGWPEAREEQVARWIGHGTVALLLNAAAQASGIDAKTLDGSDRMAEIRSAYDACYEARCGTRSRLYPGVRETLAAFRSHGIRQAIVTNKEGRYTERVLAVHDLATSVDHVISGDSLPVKKPDPAGILACLDKFGVAPDRAVFVGDSSIDAATARNAGITAWLFPHGYNMGEPITSAGADRVLPDFAELREVLLGSKAAGEPLDSARSPDTGARSPAHVPDVKLSSCKP